LQAMECGFVAFWTNWPVDGHKSSRRQPTAHRHNGLGAGPGRTDLSTPGATAPDGPGVDPPFRHPWREQWVRFSIGHHPQMGLTMPRRGPFSCAGRWMRGSTRGQARPRGSRARQHAPLAAGAAIAAGDRRSVDFLMSKFTERHLRKERCPPQDCRAGARLWRGSCLWRTRCPHDHAARSDGAAGQHRFRSTPLLANDVYRVLSLMFRFGIERLIVESSPVQLLQPPGGSETPRDKVLSVESCARTPQTRSAAPALNSSRMHDGATSTLRSGCGPSRRNMQRTDRRT
jgi:hypothetical protein